MKRKYLNIVPVPPLWESAATLFGLLLNLVINAVILGIVFYIMGEKVEKKRWEFASVVWMGTFVTSFFGFWSWTGVILIFLLYAFLSKWIMRLDPIKSVIVGVVMALLVVAGMQPQIGGPIYGVAQSAGKAFAGAGFF